MRDLLSIEQPTDDTEFQNKCDMTHDRSIVLVNKSRRLIKYLQKQQNKPIISDCLQMCMTLTLYTSLSTSHFVDLSPYLQVFWEKLALRLFNCFCGSLQ